MWNATPLLRAYAQRRRAVLEAADPAATQARVLASLLRRARDTRFGEAFGFAGIGDVAAFQRRVPLLRHEDLWRDWWQPRFPRLVDATWPGLIPFFALTSGTTGARSKRIPVSAAMVRANRRAALDLLTFHLAARPASRILGGRSFLLGGSTALGPLAPGVAEGDLSGIAAATVPPWARRRVFPPPRLALSADWERKIAALAPLSLGADVRAFSGTPSWMLLFLERLAALHPERGARLAAFYPALELLVHGGVGWAPYRARFAAWLEGGGAETREVYPASEGFLAAADRGPDEGLRLILDNGIFFEFVRPGAVADANPDRRWINDAEEGRDYALVLSTNAGLWSYVLGDVVRLLSRRPPRIAVRGRLAQDLSVFGEHLAAAELDAAIAAAARALGGAVRDYAACARFPAADRARGGHLFLVEWEAGPGAGCPEPARFAALLDAALAAGNEDYATHRAGDYGLAAPEVRLAPPGFFAAWLAGRGRLGGQNKVPRVLADADLAADLERFLARFPGAPAAGG